MEHVRVCHLRFVYFMKVEGHPFVYEGGRAGLTYKLPKHHSGRKHARSVFYRRCGQNHSSDERELRQAFEELIADPDARLLLDVSQALGA